MSGFRPAVFQLSACGETGLSGKLSRIVDVSLSGRNGQGPLIRVRGGPSIVMTFAGSNGSVSLVDRSGTDSTWMWIEIPEVDR